jgi:ferrous iron transport protein B
MARDSGGLGVWRVALAGNPNSGKSSLFNALTGENQRVANYPGITVEKKEGRYVDGDHVVELLDLPGAYSLRAFSPEERIARDGILQGRPDVVVVIADATNLERNLYLLLQVMETGANVVLALNMSDEAAAGGQRLDLPQMQALLGIPAVETVGRRGGGVEELKRAIRQVAARPNRGGRVVYGERFEAVLTRMADRLNRHLPKAAPSSRWLAIKALEEDSAAAEWLAGRVPEPDRFVDDVRGEAALLLSERQTDGPLLVADHRYAFIAGLLREVRLAELRQDSRRVSDLVDAVLCHRWLGIPIFLLMMYFLFWLTFTVGRWPMRAIELGFAGLADWLNGWWAANPESLLRSLLVDGVIGGVGGVLVFLPNIILLFFGLALLEDSGYLARAAFLTDRFMHRLGLHGKSFVPMLTGFGCSVPGLLACRTLENERDRLTTRLVLPLMSCGARLPIYLLLIPAFFPAAWQAPMLWLMYLIGIGLAVVLAKLLRSTILAGEDAPFVMELPPYRLPTWRSVGLKIGQRAWMYLRKAGTLILAISVLMWLATSFPKPQLAASAAMTPGEQAAAALEQSAAGRFGKALAHVTQTMGADWRASTAMVGAFAAKEVFVAQLGIVFSLGETDESSPTLRETLRRAYTPLQAVSMMLFLLIATPCLATLAVMRRESGSWKWALLQFGGLTVIGWFAASLVYQIGRLVG